MLWGFEALRIFGDKLKKALDAVLKAGDKAKASLENDKRIRHKDMLSGVEQVKEEYDKRHNRLQHAYNSLEQRVDQGVKLREGISSVLSVEQNENISILTWLTIIYLGPALVTGLFGMSHDIIPETAGNHFFYWLLGGLAGGTILFALLLRYIIEAVRWTISLLLNPLRKTVLRPTKEYARAMATELWKKSKDVFDPYGRGMTKPERAKRWDLERAVEKRRS
jgi:hypothetical protein